MSFQKNKYVVIKEAVPKEIATFVYNYFLLKRTVARTLFDNRYISNFTEEWGTWADSTSSKYIFALCRCSYGNFVNENFTCDGKENRIKIKSDIFLCKNI